VGLDEMHTPAVVRGGYRRGDGVWRFTVGYWGQIAGDR
jgi:hypothetical protein